MEKSFQDFVLNFETNCLTAWLRFFIYNNPSTKTTSIPQLLRLFCRCQSFCSSRYNHGLYLCPAHILHTDLVNADHEKRANYYLKSGGGKEEFHTCIVRCNIHQHGYQGEGHELHQDRSLLLHRGMGENGP